MGEILLLSTIILLVLVVWYVNKKKNIELMTNKLNYRREFNSSNSIIPMNSINKLQNKFQYFTPNNNNQNRINNNIPDSTIMNNNNMKYKLNYNNSIINTPDKNNNIIYNFFSTNRKNIFDKNDNNEDVNFSSAISKFDQLEDTPNPQNEQKIKNNDFNRNRRKRKYSDDSDKHNEKITYRSIFIEYFENIFIKYKNMILNSKYLKKAYYKYLLIYYLEKILNFIKNFISNSFYENKLSLSNSNFSNYEVNNEEINKGFKLNFENIYNLSPKRDFINRNNKIENELIMDKIEFRKENQYNLNQFMNNDKNKLDIRKYVFQENQRSDRNYEMNSNNNFNRIINFPSRFKSRNDLQIVDHNLNYNQNYLNLYNEKCNSNQKFFEFDNNYRGQFFREIKYISKRNNSHKLNNENIYLNKEVNQIIKNSLKSDEKDICIANQSLKNNPEFKIKDNSSLQKCNNNLDSNESDLRIIKNDYYENRNLLKKQISVTNIKNINDEIKYKNESNFSQNDKKLKNIDSNSNKMNCFSNEDNDNIDKDNNISIDIKSLRSNIKKNEIICSYKKTKISKDESSNIIPNKNNFNDSNLKPTDNIIFQNKKISNDFGNNLDIIRNENILDKKNKIILKDPTKNPFSYENDPNYIIMNQNEKKYLIKSCVFSNSIKNETESNYEENSKENFSKMNLKNDKDFLILNKIDLSSQKLINSSQKKNEFFKSLPSTIKKADILYQNLDFITTSIKNKNIDQTKEKYTSFNANNQEEKNFSIKDSIQLKKGDDFIRNNRFSVGFSIDKNTENDLNIKNTSKSKKETLNYRKKSSNKKMTFAPNEFKDFSDIDLLNSNKIDHINFIEEEYESYISKITNTPADANLKKNNYNKKIDNLNFHEKNIEKINIFKNLEEINKKVNINNLEKIIKDERNKNIKDKNIKSLNSDSLKQNERNRSIDFISKVKIYNLEEISFEMNKKAKKQLDILVETNKYPIEMNLNEKFHKTIDIENNKINKENNARYKDKIE